MRSKPHFHKQETRYSCVPACLRMVLGSFGVEISESELRTLCDSTPFTGTTALMAVEAARQLGFTRTAKFNITLQELESLIVGGIYPIIFVDLRPLDGVRDTHAMVVNSISEQEIAVIDPLKGWRVLPVATLDSARRLAHNLTILVDR